MVTVTPLTIVEVDAAAAPADEEEPATQLEPFIIVDGDDGPPFVEFNNLPNSMNNL